MRTLQRLDVLATPPPPLLAPGAETDGAQFLTFAIEARPPSAHPPLPAPLPRRWARETFHGPQLWGPVLGAVC